MASNALTYTSGGAAIQSHEFAYRRSADQDGTAAARHPVVVVGAGPVGLSLAIDLAQRGQRVLLLDNDVKLSTGSRAICFAKRTLEIWDRLGAGDAMCKKGVEWNVGKVYFGEDLLYHSFIVAVISFFDIFVRRHRRLLWVLGILTRVCSLE